MVNGLYGLSGEQAKQKRREKLGIPEGVKAGKDYVENVWMPAQKTNQPTQGAQPQPATGGTDSGGFFDSLPKKIFGQPAWMIFAGGALVVMTLFKGSSHGRRR